MSNLFHNASVWLRFAEEHNSKANTGAIQLNGSDSYTLAAIHVAAGVPLPKSILLDTKRARGKFVADHFAGLRQLYESGQESSRWLLAILESCRSFGGIHSVDSDFIIRNLILLTEKDPATTRVSKSTQISRITGRSDSRIEAKPCAPIRVETPCPNTDDPDYIKI